MQQPIEPEKTVAPGAASTSTAEPRSTRPAHDEPKNIGPYRILEKMGEGGMGVVYKAEQREPVRRIVALKVIKLGMDTKQVVARFEAERQALALMSHPNVAKVFEAGMTEQGRPYFAMEYVPGIPLTDYCDQNKLTTRERLELFIPVCQAVQHAHQKGIIHRDLKPGNILVSMFDGKPVPKVIDFGIAKAANQAADAAHAVHPDRHADRDARIHVARAGADQRAGCRYADRHLLAGRDSLRAAHRAIAVRCKNAAFGGDGGDGSDYPRKRAGQAQHAAERRSDR